MIEENASSELIEACYQEGRATFPLVGWSSADFAVVCRARWLGQHPRELTERLSSASARAEEYLVAACLAGRPGAARALDDAYISKIASRVHKVCGSADLADDALQALREKLLVPPEPRLASYENRGQLAAWLTIVAMRTALDVARRAQQGALRLTALDDELVAHALSPESQFSTRQLDAIVRQAMRDAVRRLPDQQRFALKMQLVAGWSIDQIGRALSAHRATAARWLVSARSAVEEDVRQALSRDLSLSAAEVDHALGALRSRLELRLSQLFPSSAHSPARLQPTRSDR